MNKPFFLFFLLGINLTQVAQVRFNSEAPDLFQKYGTPNSPIGKTAADLKVNNLGKLYIQGPLQRKDLKAFQKQTQLELLVLRNNNLSTLPEEPFGSNNLIAFSSRSNPIKNLPNKLLNSSSLMYLELTDTELDSLTSQTYLPNLQLLRIIKNNTDSLVFPDSLPGFPSLRSVEFLNVPINRFPDFLLRCPNLEQLIFNGCGLDSIPQGISVFSKLHTFDIENNAIRHLPSALASLPALRRLNVAGNKLSTFPDFIMYAPELEELRVKNNPLQPEDIEILRIIGRATKTLVD